MKRTLPIIAFALMFASTGAMAACEEIYGSMDTDGDEMISDEEFAGFYQECGIYADWDANEDEMLDEEEFADGLFDFYDEDDDGYISEVEWEDGILVDDAGDEGFWDV